MLEGSVLIVAAVFRIIGPHSISCVYVRVHTHVLLGIEPRSSHIVFRLSTIVTTASTQILETFFLFDHLIFNFFLFLLPL